MPQGLPFFDNLPEVELWAPISFEPDDNMATRNNHFITLVGRLKPGVTREQAQSDVSGIATRLEQEFTDNKGVGASIVPMQEQFVGDSRKGLLVLLGAVGFVLLVACVNVANLLLARASARSKELAIRASLCASRARIMRQVIIEWLPLGLIAGVLGTLLAVWGIDLLSTLLPATLPRGNEIAVNSRVLLFTFALALLTILIFGLLPANSPPKLTCVDHSMKADAAAWQSSTRSLATIVGHYRSCSRTRAACGIRFDVAQLHQASPSRRRIYGAKRSTMRVPLRWRSIQFRSQQVTHVNLPAWLSTINCYRGCAICQECRPQRPPLSCRLVLVMVGASS